MDIIKTMGDFKIPQFTLLTSPEQDEIVRQREAESERERESGGTFISIELGGGGKRKASCRESGNGRDRIDLFITLGFF